MTTMLTNKIHQSTPFTVAFILASFAAMSCCASPWGHQQQPNPSSPAESSETKPEAPEKVDVKPVARDEEIEQRLNEIFAATKRFDSANANVENSVVFLSGVAKQAEYKTWASDLAANTQDVAAVVNQMTVEEKSIWDFSEAFVELKEFRNGSIQAIPLIIFGMATLLVTWLLARLTAVIANRLLGKRIPNSLLRWVATRAIMLPVLIFGAYLVLRVSGLTQLALTVLGGTGLVGLVIGIAFQDIAENFLASILISVQKPFRIGDLITVDGHQGMVQRVTTRGTTLLTADGNHVQIPNSKIYKTTIENYTANPLRRLSFDIGIGYDDSTTEAQRIVLETIKGHSATLNDPAPRVLIENLGSATVNLKALIWIDGTKNDLNSVRSSCMRVAKQALLNSGVSLPDEAREVIFPDGVPVLMDANAYSGGTPVSKEGRGGRVEELKSTSKSATIVHPEPSRGTRDQVMEEVASEAEGNMASDVEDLKRQAEKSWLPGEGEEVLVGEETGEI